MASDSPTPELLHLINAARLEHDRAVRQVAGTVGRFLLHGPVALSLRRLIHQHTLP